MNHLMVSNNHKSFQSSSSSSSSSSSGSGLIPIYTVSFSVIAVISLMRFARLTLGSCKACVRLLQQSSFSQNTFKVLGREGKRRDAILGVAGKLGKWITTL